VSSVFQTSRAATEEIELDSEGHFIVGFVDTFRKADTMSTMADTKRKRSRRSFTEEFKVGAVRLVLEEGKTVGAVARDLDLTESSLRNWVEQARADRSKGRTGLTTAEREELARLRKENRILQEERDILKKATAFFAKQSR
jgi:transposase